MGEPRELVWLRRAAELSRQLAQETGVERLLPLILESAIELTEAERGYLVRVLRRPDRGPDLRVEVARGFKRTWLRGRAGDISRTVVERVLATGEGLVTTREEDADVLDAASVQERRVRSILCVPMRLRGEVRGVLYLDHRFQPGVFLPEDLPILLTLAGQAALALETAELLADSARLREQLSRRAPAPVEPPAPRASAAPRVFGRLVGTGLGAVQAAIERAARSWDPVLIQGESGAGKGLVAAELHARSPRPKEPLLVHGCAAGSQDALEAELFGDPRARSAEARQGAFLRAGRGTVVLHEVSDLGPTLQGRLVELLREVAAPRSAVACRVVATSTRDLRQQPGFREDLLHRLDVQRIVVPPLRERLDDVPALLDHFAERTRGARLELAPAALELLLAHAWPGNVLELENEARRLCGLEVERIAPEHLSPAIREGRGVALAPGPLGGRTLPDMERAMVVAALEGAKGNKARAARQLGIPRTTLYGLMERYGLTER